MKRWIFHLGSIPKPSNTALSYKTDIDIIKIDKDRATVTLNRDELGFLCNAINESLEAIEDWEYHIRTGRTTDEAQSIYDQLRNVIEQIEASDL